MGDHWAENPQFPLADWQAEVSNGDTRLGYHDWCSAMADANGTAAPTGETEYLAFCQQSDGRGTIWIEHVSGATLEAAIQEAREACADDWGYDVDSVHCLGLIEGAGTVAHWQDICDA